MATLNPPVFTNGALLSAAQLNQMSAAVNTISGAALAHTGIFCVRGVNQTWYIRRRYRYLHVAYSVTPNSGSVTVSIAFGTSTGNQWTHSSAVSWQWRTFDLNAVGGTTAGVFYAVTVTRSGTDYSYETVMIMESENSNPAATGSYTAPPTWSSGQVVTATALNALATSVRQFESVVRSPSATHIRGTGDGQTYYLRRRGRYLDYSVTVGGASYDINIYVNGVKIFNDGPSGSYTVDLDALSPSPAVGAWYSVRWEKLSGSGELVAFREYGVPPSSYAPAWTHGEYNILAKLNSYAGLLASAHATLGLVAWHTAALYRPYDHPLWTLYKNKRYLHYMRNGSTPASIVDPAGVQDSVGLKRTANSALFASYDLDAIDWLTPGALFYVYEADVVWLDDEP